MKAPLVRCLDACWLLTPGILCAQDYFSDPIPDSGISLAVEVAAVVPDSSPGQPPRISVVTEDPRGRLFANDQRGVLYRIGEDGSVAEFLDLRDYPELSVLSTSEAGFQSFAFHPDFYESGQPGYGCFYTFHACSNTASSPDFDPGGGTSFHTLLLEWHCADPQAGVFAASDSEAPYREVLRFKQPYGNHNGGLVAFNPLAARSHPDHGNLYLALADGGSGGDPQENGQDPGNPYGAILRIDPLGSDSANGKYGLVAENALAADGDPGTLAEIFCYGLRNPQRYGWDLRTGNLFVADIGQNAVEEINLAANGANFGWDTREGSFDFESGNTDGLVDPVAEYDHTRTVSDPPTSIGNRAVTVGEVARGTCIPAIEGKLLLADFPTGLIFLLDVDTDPLDGGQDGLSELKLQDESGDPIRLLDLINSARAERGLSNASRADLRFSVNTPGRIYLSNKHDGIIRRLQPTESPSISWQPEAGAGSELRFTGLLEYSSDLENWELLLPQPRSPWAPDEADEPGFWRSVNP